MGCHREITVVRRMFLQKIASVNVNPARFGKNPLNQQGGGPPADCLSRSLLFPTLAMEQRGFYNPHHHAVMDHAVENLWIADQI
ncbi:hypothetical protein JAO29_08810 [Edaphobacter sp. HDX4]